ncbi:uncharacterized protein LOC132929784 isoform X1 [Rhopalosiphum padi]|uniref:uncharacterized protein LOC132929784 isoform X1 n=2 Tax=Rhopalosiphum padi TaxID=40932 RepID=UPI00298DFEBF|nr:uncharacterized protein LOC132929784 isoform X1 [Rhopalosiphum padi]
MIQLITIEVKSLNPELSLNLIYYILSTKIDLEEELNRMERPSRVFNSHHHLSMAPVLTDTINMEQNEQVRSSRDNSYDESSSSTTQNAGNNEVAGISWNDESDEDDHTGVNFDFMRNNLILKHIGYDHRPAHARSVKRPRNFVDQPYVLINTSFPRQTPPPGVTRTNTRVNVSSTNRDFNDHPPGRSQTSEQELPEIQVIENVMEPDNSEENRNGTLDIPNETPRTRVVPVVMSPTPFSPPSESPSDTPEILATGVNNDLPNVPAAIPLTTNDDNHGSTDNTNLSPPLLRYVIRSDVRSDGSVHRTIDFELDNIENETANNSVRIDEVVNSIQDDSETISRNSHPTLTSAMHSNKQYRKIGQTSLRRVEKHPETYEDLNDQLLRLFECPVCFEHIFAPIYQCLNGHLICNTCVLKCENCPTCRKYFNSERNLYMEKVGILLKYPCKNTPNGCKHELLKIALKEKHEQECFYRQYECFFTNCSWKGTHFEVYSHMIKNHNDRVLTGSEQLLEIRLQGDNEKFKWFLSAENEYFAAFVHIVDPIQYRQFKIHVNLFGSASKAKKFKFCIQLTLRRKPSGFSQKLVYESSVLPYSEIDDALKQSAFKEEIICLSQQMINPFIKRKRHYLPITLKVGPV